MERYKCILSLNLAQYLLAKGFRILNVEKSRKFRNNLVFIFENSSQFQQALENYWKGESKATDETTKHQQPRCNHS